MGNALQAASYEGHKKIVELLLDKGANVNAKGGEYGNALQAASSGGHEKIVELLLCMGAEFNTQPYSSDPISLKLDLEWHPRYFIRMPLHPSLRGHLLKPWHTSRTCYSTVVKPGFQSSLDSPASSHRDLPSYLEYASRVGADRQSAVYIGTVYEYTVQSALAHLGMSLKRVGGKSDYGIDLLGMWDIPSALLPLKVLIQCKARGSKSTPSEIRELEGAFVGAPAGWRGTGALAFLVSQQEATKGVREAMGRSRWPMGYVMCTSQGQIRQMLWNRKAEDEGLLGVGVTVKYMGDNKDNKEILLLWPGDKPGDASSA